MGFNELIDIDPTIEMNNETSKNTDINFVFTLIFFKKFINYSSFNKIFYLYNFEDFLINIYLLIIVNNTELFYEAGKIIEEITYDVTRFLLGKDEITSAVKDKIYLEGHSFYVKAKKYVVLFLN